MPQKTRSDVVEIRDRIVQSIKEFTAEHGYPPTQRELEALVGRSKVRLQNHVYALEQEGRIKRGAGPRTITVVEQQESDG